MKNIDQHFQRIIDQLHPRKLIPSNVKDKVKALEEVCNKGKSFASKLNNICENGLNVVEKLRYLNEVIPDEEIGSKLIDSSFDRLKENKLSIIDLETITEFAYSSAKRIIETTPNSYDEIKKLSELPEKIANIVPKTKNAVSNFLTYVSKAHPNAKINDLKMHYREFKEVVHDGIFASENHADILDIKYLGQSWSEIREFFHEKGDNEGIKWVDKFEEIQNKYSHIDICEIAKLYK